MFRLLTYNDKQEYLSLVNTFRPVATMTDLEFKNIFDKIMINSEIYVYDDDDGIMATCTVLFEQKFIHNNAIYAHIEDVIVNPSIQGKGIGKLLINHIIQVCKNKSVKKIVLNCDEQLESFYGKNNFIKIGSSMAIKY